LRASERSQLRKRAIEGSGRTREAR
jgi:hypothetical protein